MKTAQPSLFASLLLGASHSVRRLFANRPADLHGAHADVVGFRAASAYDDAGHVEPRFVLDALIHPATPDAAWQPGTLTLFPSEAAATFTGTGEPADDCCCVLGAEVLEDRRFRPAADRVCTGARRVRLSLRVRPGHARLCFRHGAALFGTVVLPEAAPRSL